MIRRTSHVLLAIPLLLCCASCQPHLDYDAGPVGDFTLTERDGRTVTAADLRGKVWVASFVFTRCTGPCPQVSLTMKRLQNELKGIPDVVLLTFTVDPARDDPDELKKYADHFGADEKRWLFLTGSESEIHRLVQDGFHVPVEPAPGEKHTVEHSTRLVVVDKRGHVRGYYPGLRDAMVREEEYEAKMRELRKTVAVLADEDRGIAALRPIDFPALNASLNALAGALLIFGYGAVRAGRVRLHTATMLAALVISAIFLTSYLYFHLVIREGRETKFEEQAIHAPAWAKPTYLAILLSHVVLAIVTVPMALYTAYQGLRGRIDRHRRIARWTLPIWFYVSGTGVVVYWMLYRLFV